MSTQTSHRPRQLFEGPSASVFAGVRWVCVWFAYHVGWLNFIDQAILRRYFAEAARRAPARAVSDLLGVSQFLVSIRQLADVWAQRLARDELSVALEKRQAELALEQRKLSLDFERLVAESSMRARETSVMARELQLAKRIDELKTVARAFELGKNEILTPKGADHAFVPSVTDNAGLEQRTDRLHREFERWLDAAMQQGNRALDVVGLHGPDRPWTPAVDLLETPTEVQVNVDLPGIDPALVEVSLTGNILTVRGPQRMRIPPQGGTVHLSERMHGPFHRAIALPGPAITDTVTAELKNGVLQIRLMKSEKAPRANIGVQAPPTSAADAIRRHRELRGEAELPA